MANTLGQEDNLVDQKYVNGFIVNDDTTEFTELLTKIELQDNLPNMNPQKGVNDPNFLIIVDPQEPYIPYEPLVLGELPLIKDDYEIEFQNVQRINLQFQNRLDERMENQINTAYAPQIINRGDLETLKSFPKLQNEIEAIDEYAKTHYLTPEQVKILKQELVKNNFKEYKTVIEGVKKRRNRPPPGPPQPPQPPGAPGGPGGQPPPPPPPPGAPGGQAPQQQPQGQADGGEVAAAVAGAGGGDDQDERIGQTGERPPKPDKGEAQTIDKSNYPGDYVNRQPKVNYNLVINSFRYDVMAETYMKNNFLNSLFKSGATLNPLNSRNKFFRYFITNDQKGETQLLELYESINGKTKPAYFLDFIRNINKIVKTFSQNQYFILFNDDGSVLLPSKSPLQINTFIKIMMEFLSRCRKILIKNLDYLNLIVVDDIIRVSNTTKYKQTKDKYIEEYNKNPNYIPTGYIYRL